MSYLRQCSLVTVSKESLGVQPDNPQLTRSFSGRECLANHKCTSVDKYGSDRECDENYNLILNDSLWAIDDRGETFHTIILYPTLVALKVSVEALYYTKELERR